MPAIAAPALVIGGTTVASAAVTSAIVTGIVYGAVIGAATAVITGEDIFEGALKGAAFGGISGGIVGALGSAGAAGASGSASVITGPEAGLVPRALESGLGAAAGTTANITIPEANALYEAAPPGYSPASVSSGSGAGAGGSLTENLPSAERSFMDKLLFTKEGSLTDSAGKMISSGVEGAAKSMLSEEPESQSEYLEKIQNLNVAGDFQARTANIKIPDFWARYNPGVSQQLKQGVSAQLTPQQIAAQQKQQGGAYAKPI